MSTTPTILQDMGIFANFSQEELGELSTHVQHMKFPKEGVVFEEHTYPKGVYCLAKGKVKIFKRGDSGKEQIIFIAGAGEVLGFRTVFSEEPYRLSAEALDDLSIYFIGKEDFLNLIDENKGMRNAVLRELSRELNDKALFITNLAQKSVRERLAYSLLSLADVYGKEPINLSREDLANYVGTATETLIRLLKELKEGGFIGIQTRKLTLLNRKGLEMIAGK